MVTKELESLVSVSVRIQFGSVQFLPKIVFFSAAHLVQDRQCLLLQLAAKVSVVYIAFLTIFRSP